MNETLEQRLLKLAEIYQATENSSELVQPIYRRLLEFIRKKKYHINDSISHDFIKVESEIWKFLNDTYKKGPLTKKIHDVKDIFMTGENIRYTSNIDEYIDKYIRQHNLDESVLKNMDSNQFSDIRHNLYNLLKRVYKK